jgi:flagellar hook assembly protein FlgD
VEGTGLDRARLFPVSYALSQNYPNPFNPVTQIAYQAPETGRVRLVVYNVLGQQVRTLVDGQMVAGFYRVSWDGRDDQGRQVSSGIYLYRMEAGKFSQVHKMVLLK